MSRKREITVFVKLPSIPALVIMSVVGDAIKITDELKSTGHSVRRISSDTIVIEE